MFLKKSKLEHELISVLLFLMFFILDSVFRIRDYDEKSIDFQVVIKFVLFVSGLFFGIRYLLRVGLIQYFVRHLHMLCLLVFFLATSMYSPDLKYSLYVSLTYLSFFLFTTYALSTLGVDKVLSILVKSIYLFLLVSVYLYIFEPDLGRFVFWNDGVLEASWRMSGLAGSANNFARIVALGILIVLFNWKYFKNNFSGFYVYSFIFVSAMCLALSGSRTTIVFALFSLSLFYYFKLERNTRIYTFFIILFFSACVYFSSDLILGILSRSSSEDLSSFTGRDVIWQLTYELISDSPILGYGLGASVFLLPDFSDLLGFSPSHAHNMYLQVMLNGGWVALTIFLFVTITMIARLYRLNNYQFLCYLVFALLVGVFESGVFALSANMFTLLYYFCFCASRSNQQVK